MRKRFSESKILVAPGAYDAFTAKLIESSGFESVYLSGAGVSYTLLGQPDTGQVTQTQRVEKVGTVANATGIPLIADGDTGYGNAVNVMETVRRYEHAGAAAIQLEDQQFPKRCGHLSGKELIPADEMVGKIRAAIDARASDEFLIIARTDALGVTGMQEAILRGTKYVDAGAD
ncbi:MAG: isocitrate lyase/PEP mutase family protein, partial [Chloroflexi bacterium]|nr:isocitrate lyase/PEP mutase family protein [Chloroflexota bacterium]